jgi:hypothetical protein
MNSRILHFAALILAIGIFFVYVSPTWNGSVAEAKASIAADNDALKAINDFKDKENKLQEEQNAIDQGSLDRLTTFLPNSVDNVGLILDLNALAARSGLSLGNIDVVTEGGAAGGAPGTDVATSDQGAVGSVDMTFSAIGTFGALQSFLAGMEKSLRLLDVRDLTVKGTDTGVYSYNVTLHLYWLH